MGYFSETPICYIYNKKLDKHATGWMCSPSGYIMGPAHLFIGNNCEINHLNSINKAEKYEVFYKTKKYSAYLVFAYKKDDEFMDVALLKLIDNTSSNYDYYPVIYDCDQKESIHMAGYGEMNSDVLSPADGHYVSKTWHKKRPGIYLLKVNCQDAVQRGFSGSPVYVDSMGAVVGMQIHAMKLALDPNNQRTAEKSSIFAVPIRLLVEKFPFMREILVLNGVGYSGCKLPNRLIKDITEGNCILFVGAGCSIDAGLPSWHELIANLVEYTQDILQLEDNEKQELENLLKREKLLIVAQHCRNKLGEIEFGKFLKNQLTCTNPDDAVAYRILSTINFKAILTTNYDSLIEHFNKDATPYTVDSFTTAAFGNKPILKIHGSLEKTDSIVLTSSDIRKTIFGNEKFRTNLKGLFKNSTVFFVGYSFEDTNISLLLQDLLTNDAENLRLHYALMPNTNSIEKTYYYKDMNLSVISFSTRMNTFEPLHKVLNDLVASLPPKALKSHK